MDSFVRAVLTYRNTPDTDTGRSPAEVLFGRELRDHLPGPAVRYEARPEWILLQEDRERALAKRATKCQEDMARGSKELPCLVVGDIVRLQNQMGERSKRWDKTGDVVEVKPFQQYVVKVHGSGRLTLRNRQFLRRIVPFGAQSVNGGQPVGTGGQGQQEALGHEQVKTRPVRVKKTVDRLVVTGRGQEYGSSVPSV